MANRPGSSSSSQWPILSLVIALFGGIIAFLFINNPFFQLNQDRDPIQYIIPWNKISSLLSGQQKENEEEAIDPTDYVARARRILRTTPLIDGHNDFPFLLRQQLKNRIYDHDFEDERLAAHTDLRKMREGLMGGQFWSVYVPCPEDLVPKTGDDGDEKKFVPGLNEPNWAVRDTLEQIDVTKRLVAQYSHLLELCTDPHCIRAAHKAGKVASMIGIEGGHQTGNSLGALRQLFDLGARYVTLTHNCDNAFGTAWTTTFNKTTASSHEDPGLTPFGRHFVREMNRLGMMVDLAHVSPNTMRDVLAISRAPVIFSHSGAYSVQPHGRNVPDDVLRSLRTNGGIVMVPFVSPFLNIEHPEEATVEDVVDHILWIADVAGWEHVGLGSDFDGTVNVAKGIDDVTQWPNLIARLLVRGVSDEHARMLVGENLLRMWTQVEEVAKTIQKEEWPDEAFWEDRLWEPEYPGVPRLFPPVQQKEEV